MENRRTSAGAAALALVIALGAAFVSPKPAAASTTFVVNRTGDASDNNLTDAKCDVSTNTGKQCTLRAAIEEANDTPGIDTINFNITTANKVIAPNSPLPPVTEQVIIDGYSQSGTSKSTFLSAFNGVLKIVLDGVNAGPDANGLEIAGYKSVVKGLVIQRFSGNGILLSATKASISGNFIGTDVAGTTDRGNGIGVLVTGAQNTIGGGLRESRNVISGNEFGVRILGAEAIANVVANNLVGTAASGNTALGNDQIGVHVVDGDLNRIGGTTPEQRNVISGNGGQGISLQSDSNAVIGNSIGTTPAGTSALGNGGNGIIIIGGSNQIGGTTDAARNTISGNSGHGISLSGDGADNVIQGNRIGSRADGTNDLGNGMSGINIFGVDDTLIGGTGNAGNLITGNGNSGVRISASSERTIISGNGIVSNDEHGIYVDRGPHTFEANAIQSNGEAGIFVADTAAGVRIRANVMFANGGLGIDLESNPFASGVTNNDTDDPDTGPNGLQNYPVLTSAVRSATTNVTTVSGNLNSLPSTEFRIEVFMAAADGTGFGEGQVLVAALNVTTNAGGDRNFAFATAQLPVGVTLTSTATRVVNGSTSEFSANRTVVPGT